MEIMVGLVNTDEKITEKACVLWGPSYQCKKDVIENWSIIIGSPTS